MSEKRQRMMSSHLGVLELIFKNSNIKSVFEYGCGNHSTNFFIKNAESMVSVEMNRMAWVDKLKSEIKSDKLNLLFIRGMAAIDYFKSTNKTYDLVFVDGDGRLRKECVYNAFGSAETIVVHDVNLTWRRYRRRGWLTMEIPNDYKIITMNIAYPSTTVYTRNLSLFNELKKENSVVIRG